MKKILRICVCALFASTLLCGCGQNVNENKPIAQVQAEASKMDTTQLQAKLQECKNFIAQKQTELAKVAEKLKKIPLAEMLGNDAKNLKSEADKIGESIKKVSAQIEAYAKELDAKKSAK